MKKITYKPVLAVLIGLGLASCQKGYDPSSYAPALNIGGYTSTSQVAPANLVAYWSFSGNLVDSVSKTAGTNTGTTFTGGEKGQGLQGALNSYVVTAPSSDVKSMKSFTVTEWVNTPPPSTGIIGTFTLANTKEFWGNIEIFIENGSTNENGKLRIHVNTGASGDKTFAVDNVKNIFDKWTNIAFSYDAATAMCKLYINGSKVSTGTVGGLTGELNFANTGNIVFGCVQFQTDPSQTSGTSKQDWASYLTGQLDEVRIYNKALDDKEVDAIVKLEGRGK